MIHAKDFRLKCLGIFNLVLNEREAGGKEGERKRGSERDSETGMGREIGQMWQSVNDCLNMGEEYVAIVLFFHFAIG